MRFFSFLEGWNISAIGAVAFACGGAFFTLVLASALKRSAAFLASGGAFILATLFLSEACFEFSAEDKKAFKAGVFILYCLCYVCFLIVEKNATLRKEKRREFREMQESESYLLPPQGNGYVRDKLRAFAREEGNTKAANEGEKAFENVAIETSHARSLLKRLKKAGLSTFDRLEAERLEKNVESYVEKAAYTAEDVSKASEDFAALLKMSAKYLL